MKRTVKTLLIAAALAALSTPVLAHPPHGAGHRGPGPAWVPAHAPRHGAYHRHGPRHHHKKHHGRHYAPPRHYRHHHGPRCGHPYRGAYYRPRHPTYGAYGASLTLRLDDVYLSVHGRR